jgi:hypothetical protein
MTFAALQTRGGEPVLRLQQNSCVDYIAGAQLRDMPLICAS